MLKTITIPREDLIELVRDYILSYEGDYVEDIDDIELHADGIEVTYETEEPDYDDE